VTCEGHPAILQQCRVDVTQDEGRGIAVELHTAYKVPDFIKPVRSEDGTHWYFEVGFTWVPCWLKRPYAKFYLKVLDMHPGTMFKWVCDQVFLELDDCAAFPFVGNGPRR
jgi:hypothetical protein